MQLSRDGRHASVTLPPDVAGAPDVWVYDIARKLRIRFTFGPERSTSAVWSPDGTRLIYSMQRDTGSVLLQKAASGAGSAEVVLDDKNNNMIALSWSPDGRFLLYEIVTGAMNGNRCHSQRGYDARTRCRAMLPAARARSVFTAPLNRAPSSSASCRVMTCASTVAVGPMSTVSAVI